MTSEDDVRRIALSLPATTEKPSYGTPGFRVADKLFARMHEDPDVLVVYCADVSEKDALIAARPDVFFTTAHYDGHALVLVRLSRIGADELTDVLTESWRVRAPRRLVAKFDGTP
jgi:hypothetical protein